MEEEIRASYGRDVYVRRYVCDATLPRGLSRVFPSHYFSSTWWQIRQFAKHWQAAKKNAAGTERALTGEERAPCIDCYYSTNLIMQNPSKQYLSHEDISYFFLWSSQ